MTGSAVTSCALWNHDYTRSPEAIFKLLEVVFGAGAWGPIATTTSALDGPYAFFMWVAVGTWTLTAASYLINLTSQKIQVQPSFHELCLALTFACAHLIAAVIFCVYSFAYSRWLVRDQAIMVAIMEWITTVVYFIHGMSLPLSVATPSGFNAQPTWFWKSWTTKKDGKRAKQHQASPNQQQQQQQLQQRHFNEAVSNPVPVAPSHGLQDTAPRQPSPAVSRSNHPGVNNPYPTPQNNPYPTTQAPEEDASSAEEENVIYEDVPMDTAEYKNVERKDSNVEKRNTNRVVEENEYLNPV